jgi:hypothetical protein
LICTMSVSCFFCGAALPVMKRCTKCSPENQTFYVSGCAFQVALLSVKHSFSLQCSRDCQMGDWPRHRSECGQSETPLPSQKFAAKRICTQNERPGALGKTEECSECKGTGLVDIQASSSLPLPRLEGVMPGCVVRQKNCTVCGGDGITYSFQIPKGCEQPRWTVCHICQAYGGELCTCSP